MGKGVDTLLSWRILLGPTSIKAAPAFSPVLTDFPWSLWEAPSPETQPWAMIQGLKHHLEELPVCSSLPGSPLQPYTRFFFPVEQNKIMGRKPLKSSWNQLSRGLPQLVSDIHIGSDVSESHLTWAETWDFHVRVWDFFPPSQENLELLVWLWTREARKREGFFFFFDYHLSFIIGV